MTGVIQKRKPFSFGDTVVTLSILAMVAKAGGFAEKMVIARYFGTGASADIYFAATGIILSVVFLVKELIHPTLLPVLAKTLKENPADAAILFVRFLFLSGTILVLLGIGIALFSSQLTTIFVPGFSPEKKGQMSFVLRYLSPACLFLSLSMVTYTTLNAHKKFLRAAIPETAYKFLVLAGLFALIPVFGLQAVPVVLSFAAGVLFVSMLVSVPQRKQEMMTDSLNSQDLTKVFKLMGPIAIGVIFSHISGLVDNMLASTLPTGHLAYLNYSKKLIDAVLLIGPVALITVSYSHLAGLSHKSGPGYVDLFVKVLRILVYMGIPGIVLVVFLREPVVQILFEGGKFSSDSTAGTSKALLIYGLGFLAFALDGHLVNSFYAISDTRTPVSIGVGCVFLDIILAVCLLRIIGYSAIALALVISKYVKVLILGILLERRLKFLENSRLFSFFSRTILATVPSILLLVYLCRINASSNIINKVLVDVMLPAVGFLGMFTGFSVLFRIQEAGQMKDFLLCRLRYNKRIYP